MKNLALMPPHGDKFSLATQPQINLMSGHNTTKTELTTTKKESIQDPRGYNELMDVYSLHQLIIRKGTLLE